VVDLFTKILEGKTSATFVLVAACGFYIGKLQLDQMKAEIVEIKKDQKELTKFLAEHATTWAKLAERVEIYHKD